MQQLLGLGIGTWVVLVLLATVLLHEPPVAQAMVPDEVAVATAGFDCADVTQIPQSECEALVTFYYATGGDGWYEDDGWLVTNTPCEWYGITCEAGHVTGLALDFDTNLVGSIPPQLADLAQLKVLSLWGSDGFGLSGVIPPELGTLSHLETFELGHNSEVGIPPELGNLSSLQTLHITASLTPADPSEHLHSGGCATIPPDLGNLSNLQYLTITWSVCGTIPPELGNLSNLHLLDLSSNFGLSGSIPSELGNLSNLNYLDLSWALWACQAIGPGPMSGPLPPELGNLTNLVYLNLYCQSFSGPMPMSFVNLLQLDTLDYGDTYLCEPPDPTFQTWIAGVPNVYPSPGILCEPTSQPLYLPLVVRQG